MTKKIRDFTNVLFEDGHSGTITMDVKGIERLVEGAITKGTFTKDPTSRQKMIAELDLAALLLKANGYIPDRLLLNVGFEAYTRCIRTLQKADYIEVRSYDLEQPTAASA